MFIPGVAKPKQRARVTKAGFSFTPKATVQAEALVRLAYKQQYPDAPLFDGPVRLFVLVLRDGPTAPRWLAEYVARNETPFTSRPDWDNLGKLVSDALNQVAWHDDAQIFDARIVKRRCLGNEVPGTQITIEHCPELVPTKGERG